MLHNHKEHKVSTAPIIQFPDGDPQIQVTPGQSIHIINLLVHSPEIAAAVQAVTGDERPRLVRDHLELGFRAAELGARSHDVDSLKANMERVKGEVIRELQGLPDRIGRELGGQDGRVSAPIVQAAEGAVKLVDKQLDRVARAVEANVGPGDSTLSRRLIELQRLLDPAVDGSAPKKIAAAAGELTAPDSALMTAVTQAVANVTTPLREQLEALARQIQTNEAVAEALENTPAKGVPYEERVVEECVKWAHSTSSSVEHVGGDRRPGEVIDPVGFGPAVGRIVIECRTTKTPVGRGPVARDCDEAMAARDARAAIYLSDLPRGLAREIADWSEGETERGLWIATTHDFLPQALRYAITRQQLTGARASERAIDEAAIARNLDRIRDALRRFKDIRTKATDIGKLAHAIDDRGEEMRAEITAALVCCEEQLRVDDSAEDAQAA